MAWAKLRPERKKLEADIEFTTVRTAEIVSAKALELMSRMEETLEVESKRFQERIRQLEEQLEVNQKEVSDLLEDLTGVNIELKRLRKENLTLRHYLKEYAAVIEKCQESGFASDFEVRPLD